MFVPSAGGGFKPFDDLLGVLRMLPAQRAAAQNVLDGFRQVEPTTADWCVERHDPMPQEPIDEFGALGGNFYCGE
jgi:hypothetical protein